MKKCCRLGDASHNYNLKTLQFGHLGTLPSRNALWEVIEDEFKIGPTLRSQFQALNYPQILLKENSHENTLSIPNDSVQFSSVTQSCPALCDPMNRSTPGLPVHHQLPEFPQTHVHRVGDAIQPSHPLSSPSPPAPNPSQHQSLFQ